MFNNLARVIAAERAEGASRNIVRIEEKYIRWDEFSNSLLFTRMHCATNNSNKNRMKFGG